MWSSNRGRIQGSYIDNENPSTEPRTRLLKSRFVRLSDLCVVFHLHVVRRAVLEHLHILLRAVLEHLLLFSRAILHRIVDSGSRRLQGGGGERGLHIGTGGHREQGRRRGSSENSVRYLHGR